MLLCQKIEPVDTSITDLVGPTCNYANTSECTVDTYIT